MAEETTTTLNGFFKKRYGPQLEELIPDWNDFADAIPFDARPKLGDRFEFPVRLRRAQGYTFAAGGDAFALNAAIPGLTAPASVQAQSYVMRETIAYDAAAQATGSEDAFGDAFDEVVKDMTNSMGFHRELAICYGQSGLGAISNAGSSSATVAYTLTTASSAPGLWLQFEGAPVDVYDPTLTTKRNSNGDLTLTLVNLQTDGQTVGLSLTGASADNAAVQANDVIVPKGWVAGSMVGLKKIAENTGTLFGISASTYSLWKANTLSASSAEMTMLLATRAAAVQVQRSGRKGKKLIAFCSFPTWNDLNNNHAALRRFTESTKTGLDLGSMEGIVYYGPGVAIEFRPSALVWNSELYMAEWNSVKRVGATDLTFNLPGNSPNDPKFFLEMQSNAGYEIRGYWRQAIIPLRPAAITKISGIVNSP